MSCRLAIFTICSNNYTPLAQVFLASARRHHPEADLFLCLVDRPAADLDCYGDLAELVTLDQLGVTEPADFAFRYDVMELNTAAKPFMFARLLDELNYDRVLYFDPDIDIHAPLASVMEALDNGASLVLTPHVCHPSDVEGLDDLVFMRAGAYNLGFLAAARCEETTNLMNWWCRRLRYDCINDQGSGLFVDQKFMDLAPCFAPRAFVCHDPTLNVAYWNLSQRKLARGDDGWTVDGRPLTFFHFSGLNPVRPNRLSKYTTLFAPPMEGVLRALVDDYAGRVVAAGFGHTPMPEYAFARFVSGVPIPIQVRQMLRGRHRVWPDDPFSTYEEVLHQPCPDASLEAAPYVVTNLIRWLFDQSPWLRSNHDLSRPEGVRAVVTWFVRHAARELGFDRRLVEPVAVRLGEIPPRRTVEAAASSWRDADVSVIGYLRTTSGVGEAGRGMLRTLAAIPRLRSEGVDVDLNVAGSRGEDDGSDTLVQAATGRVEIFQINADQLPLVVEKLAPRLRAGAYRIAVPFWELAQMPEAWLPAFDKIDEIWAPSRFIQAMLAGRVAKPVVHMPPMIAQPSVMADAAAQARGAFGLSPRRFLFFFAFDVLSFPARKNPMAAIAAFRMAFPERDDAVGLVIKTMNGSRAPSAMAALREAAAGDDRIMLIDRVVTRTEMTALTAACDCVLSLHRSEGFGLLIAEAMMLGKPVIATDYGATTELVTPATGFPVAHRLVPVAEGDYPLSAGQSWAEPDVNHAAWLMQRVRADPNGCLPQVTGARLHVAERHGIAAVSARQRDRLHRLGLRFG